MSEGGPAQPVDLLITGTVVTMDSLRRVFRDGAVAVHGNTIAAVGHRTELERVYTPRRRLGGGRAIVIPGLFDCHSHAAQSLVRSLIAHELPMIYRLYLPAEDAMTLDEVDVAARLGMAQLLRSGVTTFAETTATQAHEETIASAIDAVGMRCVMARGAGDIDSHHAALYSQIADRSSVRVREGDAERDLARTEAFLDRHDPNGGGLIKGSVLASQVLGCSPQYFKAAAELARARNTSLQVHVARDREEVEFCLAVYGRRPVEQLATFGVVDEHLLAIHAILVTDHEIDLLANGGAAVAHSPIEAQNILNGVPRVRRMLDAGIAVGLGCDNALNDIFAVMRAAWLVHSTAYGIAGYDPEHLPADVIFEMATCGAARALRWDHRLGSLEAGKAADVVVLDGDSPHLVPLQNPVVDLVRYGSRAEVQHVLVGGKLLVEDRALTTIDVEPLLARAEEGGRTTARVINGLRYKPLTPSIRIE